MHYFDFHYSWEQRKVGDLLIERNQQAPMSDEYPLMAFIANEGVAPKGDRYDRSALVTDTANKLYKKTEIGDFIYSSNNLETGSIGLNKYGKACISPVYSIFEPTGIADSDFLGRRLVRKDFINAMVKWRQGVIYGQWRIHESDFLKIEIPVPSVVEQRKIGAYLDQLDRLITLHQREFVFLCKEKIEIIRYIKNTWEQRKFSDLVQIERGGSPRPIDDFITDSPDGLNWVKIGDAPAQGNYITKTAEKIKPEGLSKTREVHPGDLILSNSMSFGKPYIMGIDGCIHDGWLLIRNTYKVFDLTFLCHLLGTPQMIIQYKSLAAGSTVNNLNKELVGNTVVTIPTIKEQRVLGQYLETLDNLITLHQRKYDKLTNVKKSMLGKMFPQNGSNVPEIRFKGFTEAWEQRKFDEVFDCTIPNNTLSRAELNYESGSVRNIHYGDILIKYGSVVDVQNDEIPFATGKSSDDFKGALLRDGDIIIADTAEDETTGKACEIGNSQGLDVVSGLHTMVCRPRNKMALGYLGYYLNSDAYHHQLLPLMQGIKVLSLSRTNVQKTMVCYPKSKAEQQLIADCFRNLDNLITLHQRKPNFYTGGYYAE